MLIDLAMLVWACACMFLALQGPTGRPYLVGLGLGVPLLFYGAHEVYANGFGTSDLLFLGAGLAAALAGTALRKGAGRRGRHPPDRN